jgi:hypothetical protein
MDVELQLHALYSVCGSVGKEPSVLFYRGMGWPQKFSGPYKETPWPECANKLYRPTDRRLSAKLVPTFADRECHVVSVNDPLRS